MSFNEPLARRVLAQIDAHPERWTQSNWILTLSDEDDHQDAVEAMDYLYRDNPQAAPVVPSCGTAGCFAGWALILKGYTHSEGAGSWVRHPKTGREVYVQDEATKVLGIAQDDATELFHPGNTREMLGQFVDRLAQGRHLR